MSEFLTVVIKYEKDQEQPSFHANMEVLGGVVTGVSFNDALLSLEIAEDRLDELRMNGDS